MDSAQDSPEEESGHGDAQQIELSRFPFPPQGAGG
jgi:hypothetical protein